MLRTLQRDPALRFNEIGRVVLRMFHCCAVAAQEQEKILDSVPPYSMNLLADIFLGYAEVWSTFAATLRDRSAVAHA